MPRYSSMVSLTLNGFTPADIVNNTVLSRSVKMAVATMFDTSTEDVGDLRVLDIIPSSYPSLSPSSSYYASNTYNDYDDNKYDDGTEYNDNEYCENCVQISVDVRSIYQLYDFTLLMLNRSETFIDDFRTYAKISTDCRHCSDEG